MSAEMIARADVLRIAAEMAADNDDRARRARARAAGISHPEDRAMVERQAAMLEMGSATLRDFAQRMAAL